MEDENFSPEEYEEIEKWIPSQVKQVRAILQEEHQFSIPNHCDIFLGRCLRQKDGNVEKAVKLIQAFYGASEEFQKWDATFLPSLHADFFSSGIAVPLRNRDNCGRRVYVVRLRLWDVQETNFDQLIACLLMATYFINSQFLDVQRQGYVVVYDFADFTFQQIWAIKQWRLPYVAKLISNGVIGRIKSMHFINHPRIISVLYSGLKPFMKEKIKRRIMFHDSLDSLLKCVDPQNLPTCLGGNLDPDSDECVDKTSIRDLVNHDNYFKEMMKNKFPTS